MIMQGAHQNIGVHSKKRDYAVRLTTPGLSPNTRKTRGLNDSTSGSFGNDRVSPPIYFAKATAWEYWSMSEVYRWGFLRYQALLNARISKYCNVILPNVLREYPEVAISAMEDSKAFVSTKK
jgi:hypothetical protein